MKWIDYSDTTFLITGGTGSFGSAFIKHLLQYNPFKVICFSRDWLKQKQLRDELGDPPNVRWFIGDVRDKDRLLRAFEKVDIVIHAGAIKDLPTCQYNPREAMRTNVDGTQNVIDACIDKNVYKCLFISTDKAVNPVNVYGTTKALAENLWIGANVYVGLNQSRFSVCRYGNVAASNGSVIPIWKKMIDNGENVVPVTHEDMTRFHFEMPEVMKFVEQSLVDMEGNEIFIPKLPSIKITDLALAMGAEYKVVGIREGEKIHETMGEYNKNGVLIDSGNNPWRLTVDEIKESLKRIGY